MAGPTASLDLHVMVAPVTVNIAVGTDLFHIAADIERFLRGIARFQERPVNLAANLHDLDLFDVVLIFHWMRDGADAHLHSMGACGGNGEMLFLTLVLCLFLHENHGLSATDELTRTRV